MSVIHCLINANKLKQFEFGDAYQDKIVILEKKLRGINTFFQINNKEGVNYSTHGSITEGIAFFREHDIDDQSIYKLLTVFIDNECKT